MGLSKMAMNLFRSSRVSNFYRNILLSTKRGNSTTSSNVDPDMPVENLTNPFQTEKRKCILCHLKITVDYKNPRLLSQFLSSFTGKVYERNITGLCKKQQTLVEQEIKRSQAAGYLAYMLKKPEYTKDPVICDANKPIRPHRF